MACNLVRQLGSCNKHVQGRSCKPQQCAARHGPGAIGIKLAGRRGGVACHCERPLESLPPREAFTDSAIPWQFGFQCNERYLQWEDAAQEQLVKIFLAQKLDVDTAEVEERLKALANLLPDMVGRLQRTRADLLLRMLSDMQGIVSKLLALRELLPRCNVSMMVSRYPYLLLDLSVDDVERTLDDLRRKLPGVDVEALMEREPLLLRADIDKLLEDVRRLLPAAHDPVAILVAQPQMVLDMQTGNMPSSEDAVKY